jgi:hypothetical protein
MAGMRIDRETYLLLTRIIHLRCSSPANPWNRDILWGRSNRTVMTVRLVLNLLLVRELKNLGGTSRLNAL